VKTEPIISRVGTAWLSRPAMVEERNIAPVRARKRMPICAAE
jgi:hypothetical protein